MLAAMADNTSTKWTALNHTTINQSV